MPDRRSSLRVRPDARRFMDHRHVWEDYEYLDDPGQPGGRRINAVCIVCGVGGIPPLSWWFWAAYTVVLTGTVASLALSGISGDNWWLLLLIPTWTLPNLLLDKQESYAADWYVEHYGE